MAYNENVKEISNTLGLNPILIDFLYNRGYQTADSTKEFLMPSRDTGSPFIMSQMSLAVDRIKSAIENGEKILIFGDYDCDGICSTTILKLCLDELGGDVIYFIPKRTEGYGLSVETLERLIEEHLPDLIVTVDCGISSVDEVELCFDLGVDIIVTDHHEPQEVLPNCIIINPKIDENSPFHNLSGAGVAYKLAEALMGKDAEKYLDFAAIATVADVVPLIGVNRSIVHYGLELINERKRASLNALLDASGIEKILAEDIGFRLAPRINAPGRICEDLDMVEFFITSEDLVIKKTIEDLEKANNTRQVYTKEIFNSAIQMLTPEYLRTNKIIVLYNPTWQAGVLGLVASRLVEMYYRPVVLLTDSGEVVKGSARSIEGINIFKCLSMVSEYELGFGGHSGAAGMSVARSGVKAFTKALQEVVNTFPDELFIPKHNYDLHLSKNLMDKELCKQLALIEPTGACNPAPIFEISSADCMLTKIPNTAHIKGKLNADTDVIGFNKDFLLSTLKLGASFSLLGSVALKEFKNREYVQFSITHHILKNIDAVKDNANTFAVYLKTGLVKNDVKIDYRATYRVSSLENELGQETMHGTLFVCYSKQTATRFLTYLEERGKSDVLSLCVGNANENPINSLLLSPMKYDEFAKYSTVIFLDCPVSTKFVQNLVTKYSETEFVILPSFGFENTFKGLSIDDESIIYTARKIYEFVRQGKKANQLEDIFFSLMSFGYKFSHETFLVHFYALFEVGWVKIYEGFRITCYGVTPPLNSTFLALIRKIKQHFISK